MTAAQAYYEFLRDKLCRQDGVAIGKMMSSQAVKSKGKVFVFFHQEKMTFKLGKDFDPEAYGLMDWEYLSPFKNKPPMQAWITIPYSQQEHWETLAALALEKM